MGLQKGMFTSKTNEWETPQDFYNKLNEEFNFTLDACASLENHKCPIFFTEKENGLIQDWSSHRVFCNPPYGREVGKWVEKATMSCLKN